MVPGNFGLRRVVLAAITIFAPLAAARRAMASPRPRLAPVMNRVLPLSVRMRRLLIVSRDYTVRMFDTLVETEVLAAHLQDPDWVLFDCRFTLVDAGAGERHYLESHIPGAYYLHLEHDLSGVVTRDTGRHPLPDPRRLAELLAA